MLAIADGDPNAYDAGVPPINSAFDASDVGEGGVVGPRSPTINVTTYDRASSPEKALHARKADVIRHLTTRLEAMERRIATL